ncbi:hypothetical protein PUN28_016151 [Cardiocondyla obscurior]|uniref:Uncharacterized protein n=1 Tax=Cardiocondyla obscurior TaxID=286306 RepID=A0AAW2ESY3_9HYME
MYRIIAYGNIPPAGCHHFTDPARTTEPYKHYRIRCLILGLSPAMPDPSRETVFASLNVYSQTTRCTDRYPRRDFATTADRRTRLCPTRTWRTRLAACVVSRENDSGTQRRTKRSHGSFVKRTPHVLCRDMVARRD